MYLAYKLEPLFGELYDMNQLVNSESEEVFGVKYSGFQLKYGAKSPAAMDYVTYRELHSIQRKVCFMLCGFVSTLWNHYHIKSRRESSLFENVPSIGQIGFDR